MSEVVIGLRALCKSFGSVAALDGLDLEVERGEVHGFLGPNGAGKTTTLRVLLGLVRADSGEATVLGMDPWRDAVELHRSLAYVPGDISLWPSLSGGEIIDMLGRMRGGANEQRKQQLLELFELDPTRKTRAYSKGNRQKVVLIAALASDAEILLLDEPTAGLDPLMEARFRDLIREESGQGRTVLLSSHILAEAEALSDRVSIIRAGRVVDSGSLDQMRHLSRSSVSGELRLPPTGLEQIPGVHEVRVDGQRFSCQADQAAMDALLSRVSEFGVVSFTSRPPALEDLFLRHYSEKGEESLPVQGGETIEAAS